MRLSMAWHQKDIIDMVKAEALYPGWLQKLLTTRVNGLENYAEMLSPH
jgi:hypothetical protein